MSEPLIIRKASPHEVARAVAIDDDACALFEGVGLDVDMPPEHPFTRAEHARWTQAAEDGLAYLADRPRLGSVGMMILGIVDAAPYVDQLSVRIDSMRRGIGSRLLLYAIEWADDEDLWLTTYSHLSWNRPFYERAGFIVVPEPRCPRGIVEILDDQRQWLPDPHQRVAMRRPGRARAV